LLPSGVAGKLAYFSSLALKNSSGGFPDVATAEDVLE